MGGSEAVEWLGALEASFEAGLARDEDVAAADLAFSLRQDVDVRDALARSRTGWALTTPEAASAPVDEAGTDYVRAGDLVVRSDRVGLRSAAGPPPRVTARTFLELLGAACRAGADVQVRGYGVGTSGRLVRVGKDHVALRSGEVETIVGLATLDSVRLTGYSASRGFRG